jgi:hypothetical protein
MNKNEPEIASGGRDPIPAGIFHGGRDSIKAGTFHSA